MASKEVIVDSGLCTYDIKDREGRMFGQFTFNPSDTGIIKRHEEVIKNLEKLEVPTGSGEEFSEKLKNLDSFISEQINYLLGTNGVSETFFSIMGPFSPLSSGQFFVESVIDAIGQAIHAETGERVNKITGKIKKHTAKYHA